MLSTYLLFCILSRARAIDHLLYQWRLVALGDRRVWQSSKYRRQSPISGPRQTIARTPKEKHMKRKLQIVSSNESPAGWEYVRVVEEDDLANGWRCPKCVAAWEAFTERPPDEELH
jgi:hypothetical protein